LENVGDIIDKNFVELAEKKIILCVEFSREGRVELDGYFHKVLENFEIAVSTLRARKKSSRRSCYGKNIASTNWSATCATVISGACTRGSRNRSRRARFISMS
jgi:Na+/phosphate symporter